MRQRLTQSLRERLTALMRNSDSEANAAVEHLTRQMVLLQRAKIMTIHAFCLDLLREYGYALDLNAKSHIGSEGELNLLREKVLDDVFEAAYAEPDSGLRLLLRRGIEMSVSDRRSSNAVCRFAAISRIVFLCC